MSYEPGIVGSATRAGPTTAQSRSLNVRPVVTLFQIRPTQSRRRTRLTKRACTLSHKMLYWSAIFTIAFRATQELGLVGTQVPLKPPQHIKEDGDHFHPVMLTCQ